MLLEAGMIPEQRDPFFPKGLTGWVALSFHRAILGLTVNTVTLPIGRNSPLTLYLCNPILRGWEWTEREALG